MINLMCPECSSKEIEFVDWSELNDKNLKKLTANGGVPNDCFRCTCGHEFRFRDGGWESEF